MIRQLRTGVLMFVLGSALVSALAPAPVLAAQRQTGLELRNRRFRVDDKGRTFVTFRFVNTGNHAVIINAITINPRAGWTTVGKRVEADAFIKYSMQAPSQPEAVWLDTNEGVTKFEL